MRLILLGPPGSGKGTQAKLLSDRAHLEHIGTGDILRNAIRNGTPQGKLAKPYVDGGYLVPDELVNNLIAEYFHRPDRPERFVMDGYPRSLAQAKAFDAVLKEQGLPLTAVVLLLVDDEEILRRVTGRWSCPAPNCKRTYHVISNPPKRPGICDADNTPLVQREDDTVETLRRRLGVYQQNTKELVKYYCDQKLVRDVDGQESIEQIYHTIKQALKL